MWSHTDLIWWMRPEENEAQKLAKELHPVPAEFKIQTLSCVCDAHHVDQLDLSNAGTEDVRAWFKRHSDCTIPDAKKGWID